MTVPGVGPHLGLTPRRYQSGETDTQGRISRCGDELAGTALYEAAHSLLIRCKQPSALRSWGLKVARRRGMARAWVALLTPSCGALSGDREEERGTRGNGPNSERETKAEPA